MDQASFRAQRGIAQGVPVTGGDSRGWWAGRGRALEARSAQDESVLRSPAMERL